MPLKFQLTSISILKNITPFLVQNETRKVKLCQFNYSGVHYENNENHLSDCGEKVIIRKTNRKYRTFSDCYCQCTNLECEITFVLNVTFRHDLSPGKPAVENMIDKLIPDNKQMALDLIKTPTI
ncbi:ogr/Delta-like zinc finger family protein [Proteus terrae]|uniref:ogr/Delta-like zinc finger family protein n=1 Tax=Proteus terrae TaxID=1574161 RepID=UPI0035D4B0A2